MLKLEVALQSPDAPAGSFATKPKVMYRAGTRYCRIEEAPDADRGIHGLLIINEPNYWMINLFAFSGKHGVDPGPTFDCRMPIFPETTGSNFEFGHELDYFQAKGKTGRPGPVMQGKQTFAYRFDVGDSSLALFTYGTPERPLAVARLRGDKSDILWYRGYGEMTFDPTLFEKPANIKVEDINEEKTSRGQVTAVS